LRLTVNAAVAEGITSIATVHDSGSVDINKVMDAEYAFG
jgi:hypothetical protein